MYINNRSKLALTSLCLLACEQINQDVMELYDQEIHVKICLEII